MDINALHRELIKHFEHVKIDHVKEYIYSINTNILYNDGDSICIYLEFKGPMWIRLSDDGMLNFNTNKFVENSNIIKHIEGFKISEALKGIITSMKLDYYNVPDIAWEIYKMIERMKDIEKDYLNSINNE